MMAAIQSRHQTNRNLVTPIPSIHPLPSRPRPGKNGMVVNKVHYARDEKAFLPHASAVRVGPVNFYFLLPPQAGQEEGGGGGAAFPGVHPISSDDDDHHDNDSDGHQGGGGGGVGGTDDEGNSSGRGPLGGGGGDGGGDDEQSRTSSFSVPARPGRPSHGAPPRTTYSDLVFMAFASPELSETAKDVGLTSADVTAWITTQCVA
jgi:hypothetical protein